MCVRVCVCNGFFSPPLDGTSFFKVGLALMKPSITCAGWVGRCAHSASVRLAKSSSDEQNNQEKCSLWANQLEKDVSPSFQA